MRSLFTFFALGLVGTAIACSSGTDELVGGGSAQHLSETNAIEPATWAKCWFDSQNDDDAFNHAFLMTCSGPEDPSYPLKVTTRVRGTDRNRSDVSNAVLSPGVVEQLGGVYASKLPLDLEVVVSFVDGIFARPESSFRFEQKIEHPETITKEHPLVVKQPFSLWPIAIIQKTDRYTIAIDRLTTVPASPFTVGNVRAPSFDVSGGSFSGSARNSRAELIVIAPPNGKLTGEYLGEEHARIVIDGPGTFVADESVFRKATDADIHGDGPLEQVDPITADAGTASSADASVAKDPVPDPTCGLPKLPCCGGNGGTCNDGAYCMQRKNGFSDICDACGGKGQLCCPVSGAELGTCGASMYCLKGSNGFSNTCQPCGGADEACCGCGNRSIVNAGIGPS